MITEGDKTFLDSFEQCSLGASCWTHAAHIRMAWLLLESASSFEEALNRIKTGIKRFNSTNNSIGYHETITVAFARIIDSCRIESDSWAVFSERNPDLFQKTCLDSFYSADLLKADEARTNFIEPDRQELPETLHRQAIQEVGKI